MDNSSETGRFGPAKEPPPAMPERPDLMTWLTARLRYWIVCSWLDDAESEAA